MNHSDSIKYLFESRSFDINPKCSRFMLLKVGFIKSIIVEEQSITKLICPRKFVKANQAIVSSPLVAITTLS